MSIGKRKGAYAAKMKRATHMLFFRRHMKPGVKGWELHKVLGSDYPKVLDVMDGFLKNLDLKVTTVFEEEKTPEKPTLEELDKARFYVTLRGDLEPKEAKMIGWRIDETARRMRPLGPTGPRSGRTVPTRTSIRSPTWPN